jgi:hypothetical protein
VPEPFHERKVPAFLMERMVEPSPKLGRKPAAADRLESGRVLAGLLAETVE